MTKPQAEQRLDAPRPYEHRWAFTALATALLLAGGPMARADVTPVPNGDVRSLGTVVAPDGSGLSVTGGTLAGSNRFHRFDKFDTSSNGGGPPITGVTFQNGGASNIIVGVLSPTFITVPIGLSSPANLFWLSPAGLTIGAGASFNNVTNLTLSTATGLLLGPIGEEKTFDAVQTIASEAATLSGVPVPGTFGLVTSQDSLAQLDRSVNGDIELSNGLLTIDQSLLLDAKGGNVLLSSGRITAPGLPDQTTPRPGGDVELAGARVELRTAAATASQPSRIDVSASTGGITISGDQSGLRLDGAQLQTDSGSISLNGTLDGQTLEPALELVEGTSVQSRSGSIALSGSGVSVSSPAILAQPGTLITTLSNENPDASVSFSALDGAVSLAGEVASATPVNFFSVTQLFLDSALFSGGGLVTLPTSGITSLAGSVSARALELAGGVLTGAGSLTLTGPSVWSGGTLAGQGTLSIPQGGLLTLTGGIHNLGERTINTSGTLLWSSGAIQQVGNGSINILEGGRSNDRKGLAHTGGQDRGE